MWVGDYEWIINYDWPHLYPTRFSDNNFKTYDFNLKLTRFAIGLEVQQYGINFLRKVKSVILALMNLKTRSKEKL